MISWFVCRCKGKEILETSLQDTQTSQFLISIWVSFPQCAKTRWVILQVKHRHGKNPPLPIEKTEWKLTSCPQTILIPRTKSRRIIRGLILSFVLLALLIVLRDGYYAPRFNLKNLPQPLREESYPVPLGQTIRLPRNRKAKIPPIQHSFAPESAKAKIVRLGRLDEVRQAFTHAWGGYKKEAWGQDELRPVAGGYKSPFCGWAATMVDSLDTLLIMELQDEFMLALTELKNINFTHTEGCRINLFETTIRHLGGLLSAWDLSGEKYPVLVEKAVELGEMLYTAFDTPNRMPAPHYLWAW